MAEDQNAPPPPPGYQPPVIRPNTWREWVSDRTHDFYQALAETLPGWLGDRLPLGIPGWAADARRMENADLHAAPLYGDPGIPPGIIAYHGSRADFPRFSTNYVGSGEGTSMMGHGIYLGGKEAIGKRYRDLLSGPPGVVVGGKPAPSAPPSFAERVVGNVPPSPTVAATPEAILARRIGTTFKDAASRGQQIPMNDMLDMLASQIEQERRFATTADQFNSLTAQRLAINRFRNAGVELQSPGHLYQVRLNVDPTHLLDLAVPLSRQSPHVQEAMQRAGSRWRPGGGWNPPGETLYREMVGDRPVDELSRAERQTSNLLTQQGIPGARFLDRFSRDVAQGASAADPAMIEAQLRGLERDIAERLLSDPWMTELLGRRQALRNRLLAQGDPPSWNYLMYTANPIDILKKYGFIPPAILGSRFFSQSAAPPISPAGSPPRQGPSQ